MIPDNHFLSVLEIWSEREEKTVCRITGNSMSPVLRDGDLLTIKHGNRGIRVGDVAVFGTPKRMRAHFVVGRVVRDGREFFLLKGNQCSSFDEAVASEEILGKVVEVRGSNGHMEFDSTYWRAVNRLLAIRCFIQGRRHAGDSRFWKVFRSLSIPRLGVISPRWVVKPRLWKVICAASRLLRSSRGRRNPGGAKA